MDIIWRDWLAWVVGGVRRFKVQWHLEIHGGLQLRHLSLDGAIPNGKISGSVGIGMTRGF